MAGSDNNSQHNVEVTPGYSMKWAQEVERKVTNKR